MSNFYTGNEYIFWTVKHIHGHKCNLVEEVDPICIYITSGWCVPLRRILTKYTTVSESHPLTKVYLKSSNKIRNETLRHLEKYNLTIHPFSDARFFWNVTMLIVFNIQLFTIPMLLFFDKNFLVAFPQFYWFLRILNILCIIDIIRTFFTGYLDKSEHKIVLDKRLIAKKYLKTYFFFDLLAVCQLNFIGFETELFEPIWWLNLQWIFRLPSVVSIIKYTLDTGKRWYLPIYYCRAIAYANVLLISVTWISLFILLKRASLHGAELGLMGSDRLKNHLKIIIEGFGCMCLVTIPESWGTAYWIEKVDLLILVLIGLFVEFFAAAQILQVCVSRNITTTKYESLVNQIEEYTKYKSASKQVTNRIKSYVQFKFQRSVFQETHIMDTLSDTLRKEIAWHVCESLITKVGIFHDIPSSVLVKIVLILKQEIYLPNDVVIQIGEVGTEMYFIHVGVIAVYTSSGTEICHLSDGDHFGEIALLLNETRVASCVAVDFCELYRLNKKELNDVLQLYPAVKLKMIQLGMRRFETTTNLSMASLHARP